MNPRDAVRAKRRRAKRKARPPHWETRHLEMFIRSLHCMARDANYMANAINAFRKECVRLLNIPPGIVGQTGPRSSGTSD
jgi:hypothetical protein